MNREQFIAYTQRTDITTDELPEWFATVRDFLQDAYVEAPMPWQQSGKGSSYEEWVRLRVPLAEHITQDGSFLDVGCANGFLLECLLQWTHAKSIIISPHGVDIGAKLIALAQQRLPDYADNLHVGNSWDWQSPQKYDYVRTELIYVPIPFCQQYVERLLANIVAPDGKLIIAHYRSRTEDLTSGWVDELLTSWGYNITGITRGFNSTGIEQSRFVTITNTL